MICSKSCVVTIQVHYQIPGYNTFHEHLAYRELFEIPDILTFKLMAEVADKIYHFCSVSQAELNKNINEHALAWEQVVAETFRGELLSLEYMSCHV